MKTPNVLDGFDHDEISRELDRLRRESSRDDLYRMALFMLEMGRRLQEIVAETPDEPLPERSSQQRWPSQGELPLQQ